MAVIKGQEQGHEHCSGCSLCLLGCPVWSATRDIRLTPHGRAKALQHGAAVEELADSIDACTLCGSCEPACPEEIPLVDMIMELRARLGRAAPHAWRAPGPEMQTSAGADALLVPARSMRAAPALLDKALGLLGTRAGIAAAHDDGADIAAALEAGVTIPDERLHRFLAPLRAARRILAGDGLLLRALRGWLPRAGVESLGEALSALPAVRRALRGSDLYVIEPRAYHCDRERLARYYDAMRVTLGCSMNLDLQRLAIPTTAGSLPSAAGRGRVDPREQARGILEGLAFERVVVEDVNDVAVFAAVTDRPVLHLAEVAQGQA
jgi:ferredoxin